MSRERSVGIDAGTSFSTVASVDPSGSTAIVRNSEGELRTPSVVLFADREVVVGRDARTAITVQPDLVAEWAKRDLGLPRCPRRIGGKNFPPEVVYACVLRKLKDDVVAAFGSVGRAVITVPAQFGQRQRKATADAAELAGLEAAEIVNEPMAAALAYCESVGYLSSARAFGAK